eukprot:TRINITY_DN33096_c0_g1_i1.p1 TRINITY_DN33096_c0_g1~~TRINITY_DN33096_c0_g1_i1.p1  ORF type:complete len:360 (+),score=107.44 TRINITY_DN33096_c0_g1_i1:54-1082(+)
MADQSKNTSTTAGVFCEEDKANVESLQSGLMNVLKGKLQNLVGTSSGYIEQLPPKVKRRVEALKELQSQFDELEAKFFEERAALEAKYQKLYEPYYSKRTEIVNGDTEVTDVKEGKEGQESNQDTTNEEKGIPEFWLTAMKNIDVLAMQITSKDEEVLKFLKDIKWSRLADAKGFKLEFHFQENPYFTNTLLTKSYYMIDENEPVLERALGTEISWLPGKNVTQKLMRKKPKKGAKDTKVVTKVEKVESFFNFFTPPSIPGEEEEDEDDAEELQELMEQDYDIGTTIKDKLIPHAVTWYTGEALDDEEEDIGAFDEEGDGDSDNGLEDEDEGEEDDKHGSKE